MLQAADLPDEFTLFDEGRIGRADVAPGPREDRSRFGRQSGWKARFRRAGTARTEGPLVIESRVDVFESSDGAEQDFDAYEVEVADLLREASGAERVTDPDLGDEALAVATLQQAVTTVRFYNVIWRENNVTASVIVEGFEGNISLQDALELARKQQKRIESAAD